MRFLGLFGVAAAASILFLTGGGAAPSATKAVSCDALRSAKLGPIEGAEVIVDEVDRIPAKDGLPAYCEIKATVQPQTGVLIRLPSESWNGRFLFAGCGGLCGSTRQIADSDDALIRGYAIATTDMGHQDPTGADRSWWSEEATMKRFHSVSTHQATLLAKETIAAFYGRRQSFSYIRGCSTGGRQALTEALLHPDQYDGVIAGAPATDAGTPTNAFAYFTNLDAAGKPILDAPAIGLLSEAVMGACDRKDGAADRLISNPLACRFDPAVLTCKPGQTASCLTPRQVAVAKAIAEGPRGPDGKLWGAVGYAPGSERFWAASLAGVDGKPPARSFSAPGYLEGMIGKGAKPADFDFARHGIDGGPLKVRLDLGPDGKALQSFLARKGKVLLWHGWADIEATPATSLRFYEANQKALGQAALNDSFRLFMIPGVGHCRGGDGPDAVDTLSAMEAWVERGQAPARLTAYKLAPGAERPMSFPPPAGDTAFSRPLYPYPAYAHHDGKGDLKSAASFSRR